MCDREGAVWTKLGPALQQKSCQANPGLCESHGKRKN
jgi:hypothetical protein